MTNKQTQPQLETTTDDVKLHLGPITPQLLRRRYQLIDAYISRIRSKSIENGLDKNRAEDYSPSKMKLMSRDKLENFLAKATNKRTGKWITLEELLSAGVIGEIELEQYDGKVFPHFRLNRLTRVYDSSGNQWLTRFITIYGLDASGNMIHTSLFNIDYYSLPSVTYLNVPTNPKDRDDSDSKIRVGIIDDNGVGHDPFTPKRYLLPYSEEAVHQIIKDSPPEGMSFENKNVVGLQWHKEGETSPDTGAENLAEFLAPNFVDVFRQKRTPTPQVHVDGKDLLNYVKSNAGSREAQQYG